MDESELDINGSRGTVEGGKLKETGTTNWLASTSGVTNEIDSVTVA